MTLKLSAIASHESIHNIGDCRDNLLEDTEQHPESKEAGVVLHHSRKGHHDAPRSGEHSKVVLWTFKFLK